MGGGGVGGAKSKSLTPFTGNVFKKCIAPGSKWRTQWSTSLWTVGRLGIALIFLFLLNELFSPKNTYNHRDY